MHSYGSFLLLTYSQKIIHNLLKELVQRMKSYVRWSWTINKEEICMLYPSLNELLSVIFCLIKSDDMGYIEVLKNLEIVFWAIPSSLLFIIYGTHKRNEFIGNNPIQISVFNFFVVIIFFWIKVSKRIPSKLQSYFQSL